MYQLKPRSYYRTKFDGSDELFASCWSHYRSLLTGSIDGPKTDDDVMRWLDEIASLKVNDPGSRFFIHG